MGGERQGLFLQGQLGSPQPSASVVLTWEAQQRPPSVNHCCLKRNPLSQPLAGSDRGADPHSCSPPAALFPGCTWLLKPQCHQESCSAMLDAAQLTTTGTLWADAGGTSPTLSHRSWWPRGEERGLADIRTI